MKYNMHGLSRTKIYSSWQQMKRRCTDKKFKQYVDYGGRGITYCKDWESFNNFKNDMLSSHRDGLQLDRIDNDKGYCKENCRWATEYQQKRNTRRNSWFTFKGKTQCLRDWAREYKMFDNTLCNRLYRAGWDIGKALTTPLTR